MTPEQLEAAIRSGDKDACLRLVCGASEIERHAAAGTVIAFCRSTAAAFTDFVSQGKQTLPAGLDLHHLTATVGLAAMGSLSVAQLRELGWAARPPRGCILPVLLARPPEWRSAWVQKTLTDGVPQQEEWLAIRHLVREGLHPRPEHEHYLLGMIGHPRAWDSMRDFLLKDPTLLEQEVWRLFEVEGGGEFSLASHDKYANEGAAWGPALAQLVTEGVVARDRLLDASLDALARDFGQFRAGWFSRFHESLAPTPLERCARLAAYLSLLSSRVPPTVSFALKAIAIIEKAGQLPPTELIARIGTALSAREKATVTQSLRFIQRAVKRDPAFSEAAALLATEALAHEAPEVQGLALDLIERHGNSSASELRSALDRRRDFLAPSQRPRLEALLGVKEEPTPRPRPAGSDELLARAAAIPEPWRTLAGIDAAVEALRRSEGPKLPPAVDVANRRIPRLDPETAIQPVASLDELIELYTVLLENEPPPEDIERVLDGVARLGAERPPDWERRTGPLRKRLCKLAEPADQYFRYDHPQGSLCALGMAWLTGELLPARGETTPSLEGFLVRRVLEITPEVAAGRGGPLLSLPTHAAGWIDPRVLVQRILSAGEKPFGSLDTVLALLRLAPDHRPEALSRVGAVSGELGDALRHALGAEGIIIGPGAALWAAAARARNPDADDPAVEERHPGLGPDTGRVAHLQLGRQQYVRRFDSVVCWRNILESDPPLPEQVNPNLATTLASQPSSRITAAMNRWGATVWPAGSERRFAVGAFLFAGNQDWWEAQWGNRAYLEGLLPPDVPYSLHARLLLGLGLGAKEPGESGLATDALIAAIEDGRVDAAILSAALSDLLGLALARPLRWAKMLAEAARISPLHAEVIRQALERTPITGIELRPAEQVALLQLLHELSVQNGAAIHSPETRAYLSTVKGGKSGALAAALLALKESAAHAEFHAAAEPALRGRIERAERWIHMTSTSA